jgi:hypothetical protein
MYQNSQKIRFELGKRLKNMLYEDLVNQILETGISGSTDYYLSEIDTKYFKEISNTRCQENNCFDMKESAQLAFSIKIQRIKIVRNMLQFRACSILAINIPKPDE